MRRTCLALLGVLLSLTARGQDPARAAFEIHVGPRASGSGADVSGPHGRNEAQYPMDSLVNPGSLYSLPNQLPPSRVHHAMAIGPLGTEEFVIVHGGYATDGTYLDDLHLFDTRSQRWSGTVLRMHGYDDRGRETNLMNADEYDTTSDATRSTRASTTFAGDLPLARAEHKTVFAGSLNLLYMFGGDSALGLSNDFYSFDPFNLEWHVVESFSSITPSRRAGHSMFSYKTNIYLFGGRSSEAGVLQAMNDLWMYSEADRVWTHLGASGQTLDNIPVGRQHSAMAILQEYIFIFGGEHPTQGNIYSDLWRFDLQTGLWSELASQSTRSGATGFSPPPMYKANAIALDISCGNSEKHDQEDALLLHTNPNQPNTTDTGCGLLIYGGVYESGVKTSLGQLYRVNLEMKPLSRQGEVQADGTFAPRVTPDPDGMLEVTGSSWEYARITSGGSDRGRLRKVFGYEEVAYSSLRMLMFEFGGLQAVSEVLVSNNQTQDGPYSPASFDGGGYTGGALFDLHTGEHLRTHVDLPTNGHWDYADAFTQSQPQLDFEHVKFLQEFRTYAINYRDLVQLIVQSPPDV